MKVTHNDAWKKLWHLVASGGCFGCGSSCEDGSHDSSRSKQQQQQPEVAREVITLLFQREREDGDDLLDVLKEFADKPCTPCTIYHVPNMHCCNIHKKIFCSVYT